MSNLGVPGAPLLASGASRFSGVVVAADGTKSTFTINVIDRRLLEPAARRGSPSVRQLSGSAGWPESMAVPCSDLALEDGWTRDASIAADPTDICMPATASITYGHALADDDGKHVLQQTDLGVQPTSALLALHSAEVTAPDEIWEIHHGSIGDMPADVRRRAKMGDPTVLIR
jgi:hypothetical protein